MFDVTEAQIVKISAHRVGNKTNGESLSLSGTEIRLADDKIKELLLSFFLRPFGQPEYYAFTFSNKDFVLNPVYNFVNNIFGDIRTFHKNSKDLAKLLYEVSGHPQVKSGDLFVVYFSGLQIAGETTDMVGIFKSENTQSFLKAQAGDGEYSLGYDDGINIEKLDRGCVVMNLDQETGYRIAVIDKAAKADPVYWKDVFLQIAPRNDSYHSTKQVMNIARNFIAEQLTEEYDCTRAQQIDMLNRSVQYFKENETFEKDDFEQKIFQDKELIQSFRKFDETYRETNDLEIEDTFGISGQAVKKQARTFKSVLKLDKNFHIYIHGDRDLIEQGTDNRGRKYYKIYYEEES
jgi:hypothetical protein